MRENPLASSWILKVSRAIVAIPSPRKNPMATRVMKPREPADPAPEIDRPGSQRNRPEVGRYLLQVDRQTKSSYATTEGAEAVGLVIKTKHPIVQVSVYDSVDCVNKVIELPVAAT